MGPESLRLRSITKSPNALRYQGISVYYPPLLYYPPPLVFDHFAPQVRFWGCFEGILYYPPLFSTTSRTRGDNTGIYPDCMRASTQWNVADPFPLPLSVGLASLFLFGYGKVGVELWKFWKFKKSIFFQVFGNQNKKETMDSGDIRVLPPPLIRQMVANKGGEYRIASKHPQNRACGTKWSLIRRGRYTDTKGYPWVPPCFQMVRNKGGKTQNRPLRAQMVRNKGETHGYPLMPW